MVGLGGVGMTFSSVLVVLAEFVHWGSGLLLAVGELGHWGCSLTVTGNGVADARILLPDGGH